MPLDNNQTIAAPIEKRSRVAAFLDNDIVYSFLHSRITITAALVTVIIVLAALLAPVLSPQDPYDLRQLSLIDSHNPPAWLEGGDARFLLGSDPGGIERLHHVAGGEVKRSAGAAPEELPGHVIHVSQHLLDEVYHREVETTRHQTQ